MERETTLLSDKSPRPGCKYPQVERCAGLSIGEFDRRFKSRRRPVVLTDAAKRWSATSKWSFAFFQTYYGATPVTVSKYNGQWYRAGDSAQMPLRDFIGGLLASDWQSFPLYIRDYWGLFEKHPELLIDCPVPEYFFDWVSRMPKFMQRPGPRLFMGPKGAITPLHVDIWGTHAWLTQVVGRKRWILISPEEECFLDTRRAGDTGLKNWRVDPESSDFVREFPNIHPVECTLAAGETIFVPGGWLHHVTSLDAGISITANFMGPGCFYPVLPNAIRDLVIKRISKRFA